MRKSGKEVKLAEGEIFIYQLVEHNCFEALVSDSRNFRPGAKIFITPELFFESHHFTENGILMSIHGQELFDFLDQNAEMPLPPYIQYSKEKEAWYQTFFAEQVGSAAAPTASLHFTPELVTTLENRGVHFERVCLHVGLGTFKPVYEEIITNQKLHFEPMFIPHTLWNTIAQAKKEHKIFLPVGTTMIRFLESLPYIWHFLKKKKNLTQLQNFFAQVDPETQAWRDQLTINIPETLISEFLPDQKISFMTDYLQIQTRLFIRPGIPFYLTDQLITNFHLPKSSLMMLISAFMGRKNLLDCYQEAIDREYRFFSFGDGMRITQQLLQ